MGKPRCHGCKKLGNMIHTLKKVVTISSSSGCIKRLVWFNEECWDIYENKKK